MIKEFNNFLKEGLGRLEQVEIVTDLIWEVYKNAPEDKKFELYDIEAGDFKIKKLTIDHVNDENNPNSWWFSQKSYINNIGDYHVFLSRNLYHKFNNKGILHHELVHAYEFYKNKTKISYSDFDIFNNIDSKTPIIYDFLLVMYLIDEAEIRAYYNQSIVFIKENKKRFRKFKYIIKHTPLFQWYETVKHFDIEKMKDLDKDEMKCLVELYYKMRTEEKELYKPKGYKNWFQFYKEMFFDLLKINKKKPLITDKEIESFIIRFDNEIELKKKLYIKYIGRLRILMEY